MPAMTTLPETPVTMVTTGIAPSRPAAANGASARVAAVALQPGLATIVASANSVRCSSGRPYTASAIRSGWGCGPYQVA